MHVDVPELLGKLLEENNLTKISRRSFHDEMIIFEVASVAPCINLIGIFYTNIEHPTPVNYDWRYAVTSHLLRRRNFELVIGNL